MLTLSKIQELLGDEAQSLLTHTCQGILKKDLHLPGSDSVDRLYANSDRSIPVLRSLQTLLSHGRLGGTGYLSILPVDQGVEHSAGASFSPNPMYFDPEAIVKLAIEGGCNGVASTLGVLKSVARKYAHKIPFILKVNHNEFLSYPNTYDQTLFASATQAYNMGAVAIGATIYFGSPESRRQIQEVSEVFQHAHELGMATMLWCYTRNPGFKVDGVDYHESADLSGQANHLGATIGADILKQKLPTCNGGYRALNKDKKGSYGKYNDKMYEMTPENHPVDLCRYQVLNGYNGRVGLINSGGASTKNNLADAVKTAVINKRAGGMGLISGRKTFQCSMAEGVRIFNAIQDVYLNKEITIA